MRRWNERWHLVVAEDSDATNNSVTYSLADSAGGRFAINSTTGLVTVASGAGLDHETTASHTIVVQSRVPAMVRLPRRALPLRS